jgi:hypothetical protein
MSRKQLLVAAVRFVLIVAAIAGFAYYAARNGAL